MFVLTDARPTVSMAMRHAVISLAAIMSVLLVSASPAGALSSAPVYSGDFPDPFVRLVGSTYWAYSTGSAGRNLQVMSFQDQQTWSAPADPLPTLPSWARAGFTWAPSVLQQGNRFLMYYTARHAKYERQCISVATSTVPQGPFLDRSSGPLVCQLANGGSIDPSPFIAADGTKYLLWKSDDNAIGKRTYLWSPKLSSDGLSLVGRQVRLLGQDQSWQGPVIEGPSMVAVDGAHYLFYGANNWDSANAAIGYARCNTPLGPCKNASTTGPWMASHGDAVGPSGPEVFRDATGAAKLAYHAWTNGVGYHNGGVRSLWIDNLTFANGQPTLN